MPDLSISAAGRLTAVDPKQRLHRAVQQFEQQFAARILQPLSESGEDGAFGSGDPGDAMFKGMLVDGLAEHAAGGLGIARIVEQQLVAQRIRAKG